LNVWTWSWNKAETLCVRKFKKVHGNYLKQHDRGRLQSGTLRSFAEAANAHEAFPRNCGNIFVVMQRVSSNQTPSDIWNSLTECQNNRQGDRPFTMIKQSDFFAEILR
jgi:hypothetical protein